MAWFRKNKIDAEDLTSAARNCVAEISEKWKYFCETLPFKAEVTLDQRLEAFSMPILEFVEKKYDFLLKGPNPGEFFWTMVFTGVLQSKTHESHDVNVAIEILGKRMRK